MSTEIRVKYQTNRTVSVMPEDEIRGLSLPAGTTILRAVDSDEIQYRRPKEVNYSKAVIPFVHLLLASPWFDVICEIPATEPKPTPVKGTERALLKALNAPITWEWVEGDGVWLKQSGKYSFLAFIEQ